MIKDGRGGRGRRLTGWRARGRLLKSLLIPTTVQINPRGTERRQGLAPPSPCSPPDQQPLAATWRRLCTTPWGRGLPTTWFSAAHAISIYQGMIGRNTPPDPGRRSLNPPPLRPYL